MARASGDQIGNLQAQAQALSARITQLGQQEDALAQQYDEATIQLQSAQQKVADATTQVATANAEVARARRALKAEALGAYLRGGFNTPGAPTVSNATKNLLAHEYVQSLAAEQQDDVQQFHLASVQAETARQNLQAQQSAVQRRLDQLAHAKQAGLAAEAQLQAALNQDKGQIAALIAQRQAAQGAAALAAARARTQPPQLSPQLSGARTNAPPSSRGAPPAQPQAPLPPVGSGAAGAVRAALSRVGAPYVFGGAGPWGFDCSGLVMWAYAQVGISLPHPSAAQYAATTHIPMSALQPGDIVWVANVSQHEAMYIGGGQIVEAQHTGTNVLVTPLRSEFVLAGRVG